MERPQLDKEPPWGRGDPKPALLDTKATEPRYLITWEKPAKAGEAGAALNVTAKDQQSPRGPRTETPNHTSETF